MNSLPIPSFERSQAAQATPNDRSRASSIPAQTTRLKSRTAARRALSLTVAVTYSKGLPAGGLGAVWLVRGRCWARRQSAL